MRNNGYHLSISEIIRFGAIFIAVELVFSYLFYDSFYSFIILMLFTPFLFIRQIKLLSKRRNAELSTQFCELIGSLSTVIAAGVSIDNAFYVCRDDMKKLFGEDSIIVREVDEIIKGQTVSKSVSDSLKDLARRTDNEDIKDFVAVFCEAIKTGGNLSEIIKSTVLLMQDKKRTEDEIEAMLKGKALEQKIMSVIPLLIFIYLKLSSKEFIASLYHNLPGQIIMTVCLLTYAASFMISERIVDIRV